MNSSRELLKQFLLQHKKKTVLTAEIQTFLRCDDPKTIYDLIRWAEEEGCLEPVKASGRNGNRLYPLYLKYRIVQSRGAAQEMITQLREQLHPRLLANGYLTLHPQSCQQWKEELFQLSSYLFQHTDREEPISRKERSFAIFHQEKLLDQSAFWTLLKKLGLNQNTLAFYDTPENCLCDYICAHKERLCLLICENKDIWYNLRRMMFEKSRTILWDTPLDGVVYGQGNHISQKYLLTEYSRFLDAGEVDYLYWGDLDREGLRIFLRTREANPDLHLRLFSEAYEEMLRLAEHIPLPPSEDTRGKIPELSALHWNMPPERLAQAESILRQNLRLPQEIVSYSYLNQQMR